LVNLFLMCYLDLTLEVFQSRLLRFYASSLVFLCCTGFLTSIVAVIGIQVQGNGNVFEQVGSIGELVGVTCLLLYYSCYIGEFRKVSIEFFVFKGEPRLSKVDIV